MAQLFFQPVWQAVDANGAPLSGALLYFFNTGTSTPLTVYQDSGLVTPHAIPVVADTAGMFAPIYVGVSQYKVVLKTSAGVTVQTIDPVSVALGSQILESTDSGATAGPDLTLLRSSASPAANDIIGRVLYQGKDSAANTQDYAEIEVRIDDTTNASEDASLLLRTMVAGTMTTGMVISGTVTKPGSNDGAPLGASGTAWSDLFLASGGVINWNSGDVTVTHSANLLAFAGASNGYTFDTLIKPSANDGAALGVSGTAWSDAFFASGAVLNFNAGDVTITHSAGLLTLLGDFYAGGTVYLGQNSSGTPGAGNNTIGGCFNVSNSALFVSSFAASHYFNRTNDGTLISLDSAGTTQGTISISGATTTYAAFMGSHWSQLADGSRPDILRGTIVESIDQMCEWPGEGPEDRLPRFKISDTPGSKAVYGVFAWWEKPEDWDMTNDAYIGSLGAYLIRIAAGQTVLRGDYIESAGNGCGQVQADDILKASTVAKVTSATIIETYPDGSYLVPCTLHCG